MSGDLGAIWLDDKQCRFRVWAPKSKEVQLHIVAPEDRLIPMQARESGYHQGTLHVTPGTQYLYRLERGKEFPDPASRYQPLGVLGPSEIMDPCFDWRDQHWFGLPIENYIIYELHVGTFTTEGTFDAIIPHLDYLADTGITAVELMPVAQFSGARNWGYDGVFLFAVQNSYGGPAGLMKLVDACHRRGLAVILDVVYNHIGPESNVLPEFGPYFTERYKTPWGPAVNFDDAHSDEVRHFFIQNALYWITEFHVDALRLDAVHAILDHSAVNVLQELSDAVHERGTALNRRVYTIAESVLNDSRLLRPAELGGYGLDAQWNDDFHHSLHTLLTKERQGYYVDFGDFQQMARAFSEGFVYAGRYSVFRGRRHGNSSRGIPPAKFVVYSKNHDHIGNRMMGERLNQLVPFESLKLAASLVLLSPFTPLIFMGDEYAETAPFQYFVSHSDPALVAAVRRGRKHEFASFKWKGEPPDPQDEATFQRSKLNHCLRQQGRHRTLLEFHRELIRLRKSVPALACPSREKMDVASFEEEQLLAIRRWNDNNEVFAIFNFNDKHARFELRLPSGRWIKKLDSDDERWEGRGSAVPDALAAFGGQPLPEGEGFTLNPKQVLLFEREIED